jgi:flagellar assembly factor FliW
MAPDYMPRMAQEDLRFFGVESEKDLIFLVIATVPADDVRKLSINTKSPIALNPMRMIGRQVLLLNEDYSVRYHPFLDDGAARTSAKKAPSTREEGR